MIVDYAPRTTLKYPLRFLGALHQRYCAKPDQSARPIERLGSSIVIGNRVSAWGDGPLLASSLAWVRHMDGVNGYHFYQRRR